MPYFEEIIKKLGWDDGFQIPVANAENQELEQELIALTLRKIKAKNDLENSVTRQNNIQDHFKYIKQEHEHNQKLFTAHKQQNDDEVNHYHILKAELTKTERCTTEVSKRIAFLGERKEILRNELQKAVIKVDRIKQETGWDIEALKGWEEALKKRDNDNELFKKVSKEDERRFNELEAKRQLLQAEYDWKHQAIGKIVCELKSCEMIIERTGKAIVQQIDERESIKKQWQNAMQMLQQRNKDIEGYHLNMEVLRNSLQSAEIRLQEENNMLENEERQNQKMKMKIQNLNEQHSRMKEGLERLVNIIATTRGEYSVLKRKVSSSSQLLGKLRLQSKEQDKDIDKYKRVIIKNEKKIKTLYGQIEDMKNTTNSSSERVEKIYKMIDVEEKRCALLTTDTEKINNHLYRTVQLLKEQESIGKTLEAQINNCQCIANKLRKHIRDEKRSLEKLKEVVYDMQFRIDEFEQKLCKLEGSNNKDEFVDEKEEKIKELEKTLADHSEVLHTLQNQVDRLQDEMRKLSNFIAANMDQLEVVQNSVENYLLEYDIGRKHIAAARKSCQEKQVEENIMRLRIDHIEGDMQKANQKIFSLQKLRLSLDTATKEHILNIDTKNTVVNAKRKHLDEEMSRLKSDITLQKVKVEHLMKKYYIELMSLGKDDDGQPLSIAHIKIQNAQEKFMLQQEGDELDQKIKIAEQEIVAIENTLKLVNLSNVCFRNNLAPLKEDDLEVQEVKTLERELKDWILKARKARNDLMEQEKIHDDLSKTLNETLMVEKQERKELTRQLEEENCLIEKQRKNKEEKVKRTHHLIRQALKKLRNRTDFSIYEQDSEVRQLRDANNTVIKKLYSLSSEYPDIAPNLNKYTTEQNIDLQSFASLSSESFSSTSSIHSRVSTNRSFSMESVAVATTKVDILFK
ncbi:unnamed protein product [Ceutorhynchus assimilis]|uniref:Coiled-coil domain-containing protein 39 n=1 Tax=Ceutorhynchus assimilis TaxID=467358 RepID=A0A9P0GNB9_9CUCU|nr:unnamed protein product [Ceutorhynchus assimilis]